MTVVAIVPAKDREDSIERTVTALLDVEAVDRVLVVDDGSRDATTERARLAGASVLRLASNVGKGGAVAAGVEAAGDADVYLLIDADIGDDAAMASALLQPVLDDEADMTIGVLPSAGKRGGFGAVRRMARWGIERGSGFDSAAPLSGQRAIRAEWLRGSAGAPRFGLEVALSIDLVRAGARVREVEVAMEHRHTGRSWSGFRHRGIQGIDVAAALWPRLCHRWIRRSLLALVLLGLIAASVVTSRTDPVANVPLPSTAKHVVIIGVPHLGFDDFNAKTMPNMLEIGKQGAIGMMAVETAGGSSSGPVYATLGAGYAASGSGDQAMALGRDERIEDSRAIDVLERRSGDRPDGAIVMPGFPTLMRRASNHADSHPGALGDVLHADGRSTAVVANSSSIDSTGQLYRSAPAALAVVSGTGAVDRGDVSMRLLRRDPRAPFGFVPDDARFIQAFDKVAPKATVTIIDTGQTDRVGAYRSVMTSNVANAAMQRALRRTDVLIGRIRARLQPDTLLIIMSASPPAGTSELLPIVVSGAGVGPGRLESPSTSRPGLVVLTDLAPTVLSSLNLTVPAAMVGRPLRWSSANPDLPALRAQNRRAVDRNAAYGGFQASFIYLLMTLYALATIALVRVDTPESVKRLVSGALVASAAVPIVTFVIRLVPALGSWGIGTALVVYVISALVAWWLSGRGRTPISPLVAISAFGLVLFSVDFMTGAHLQVSSLLGYVPTAAARFVGIGNSAFAVLGANAVIVIVWIMSRSTRPKDAWWCAAALAAWVIVVDGAPWLGSDVGGILTFVPSLSILMIMLRGKRIRITTLIGPVIAAVGALGAVVVYESLQKPSERDHIGRFFLGGPEGGTFWTTLSRKLSTNVRLLFGSPWSELIPLIIGFIMVVYLFTRWWPLIFPKRSVARRGLIGLALVAVIGYATNDSGAMAAALMLVFIGPYVGVAALAEPRDADELLEPTAPRSVTS